MPLQSLEEFNNCFFSEYRTNVQQCRFVVKSSGRGRSKNYGPAALISDILFYLAIAMVLLVVVTSGSASGAPKVIAGFSYFTVLSASMQSEIPQGSFILVQEANPGSLKVGDTVTYMRDRNTTVTHKIIGIYENYQNGGAIGFITQGVNNANPDKEIVHEANIVGKVILVLPGVGAVISSLRANLHVLFVMFALCLILSFSLRGIFVRPKNMGGGVAYG